MKGLDFLHTTSLMTYSTCKISCRRRYFWVICRCWGSIFPSCFVGTPTVQSVTLETCAWTPNLVVQLPGLCWSCVPPAFDRTPVSFSTAPYHQLILHHSFCLYRVNTNGFCGVTVILIHISCLSLNLDYVYIVSYSRGNVKCSFSPIQSVTYAPVAS